jgi:hypothetical protein
MISAKLECILAGVHYPQSDHYILGEPFVVNVPFLKNDYSTFCE